MPELTSTCTARGSEASQNHYYGSVENSIQEIDDILEAEIGRKVSQCRVRSLPLSPVVEQFIRDHETVIVLEINRDGQLTEFCENCKMI